MIFENRLKFYENGWDLHKNLQAIRFWPPLSPKIRPGVNFKKNRPADDVVMVIKMPRIRGGTTKTEPWRWQEIAKVPGRTDNKRSRRAEVDKLRRMPMKMMKKKPLQSQFRSLLQVEVPRNRQMEDNWVQLLWAPTYTHLSSHLSMPQSIFNSLTSSSLVKSVKMQSCSRFHQL